MSIQRDIYPDIQTPEICTFLCDYSTSHFTNELEVTLDWTAAGYEISSVANRQVGRSPVTLASYRKHQVDLSSPIGRLIRSCQIIDVTSHPIDILVWSKLFLKSGIAVDKRSLIENVFQTTVMDGDDISAAEDTLAAQGILPNDFQVALFFSLERTSAPTYSHSNLDAFVEQMTRQVDGYGQRLYSVSVKEAVEHSCEEQDQKFPDDDVLIVPDADQPVDEIQREENEEHRECEGLEITDHRIGTAFQYLEFKIEWEMRDVRIGRCRIMRTKLPILYTRTRKYALLGIAMSKEETKRNAENAIKYCLILAAVNTAALAIVTGGLGLAAAAQAFVASTMICLETKIGDAVNCFFVKLELVAEYGDWHEGV